jgi:hypothetical protein
MADFSHLEAIEQRLLHERARVMQANPGKEREWREHNVRQIEKERDAEIAFLERSGVKFPTIDDILDDELIAVLQDNPG